MNWVAPIRDEETLNAFRKALRRYGDKYYIMFEIGIGTGMQLMDILKLHIGDIRDKDGLTGYIGVHRYPVEMTFSDELKEIIAEYVKDKRDDDVLVTGFEKSKAMVSREQVYRVFKSAGREVGLSSIGAQTMRKTFAWNHYKEHNDIQYLQELFSHATPSITYRFIGEKPNLEIVFKKQTAEENSLSRRLLYKDRNGEKRIDAIIDLMSEIKDGLNDPVNPDVYYGQVDTLLKELESVINNYKSERDAM